MTFYTEPQYDADGNMTTRFYGSTGYVRGQESRIYVVIEDTGPSRDELVALLNEEFEELYKDEDTK